MHFQSIRGLTGSDHLTTADGTAATLAREAASIIAERGEHAVRISEVCRRAGVSPASLYLWYTDRDHLIAAAHLVLFSTSSQAMLAGLRQAVVDGLDREGFTRMVGELIGLVLAPERRQYRAIRLHSHGMARHRPALRAAMADIRREEQAALTAIIADAAERGLLTTPDPVLTASWIQSHIAGHTLVDGGNSVIPSETWDAIWTWSLRLVVLGDRRPFPHTISTPTDIGEDPATARQSRSHPTADRLADWAADEIDAVGESALRLDRIPTTIARSTTPVYQYFGGREGLVVAAQSRRFLTVITATLDAVADELEAIDDPAALRTALAAAIDRAFGDESRDHRVRRVESFAAVHGRPQLRAMMREAQDGALTRLIAIIDHAARVGAVAPDSSLPAAALIACGMFATGFTEVAGTAERLDEERAMTISAIHAALGWH
jgi:AcrR family transcriptional regulator